MRKELNEFEDEEEYMRKSRTISDDTKEWWRAKRSREDQEVGKEGQKMGRRRWHRKKVGTRRYRPGGGEDQKRRWRYSG